MPTTLDILKMIQQGNQPSKLPPNVAALLQGRPQQPTPMLQQPQPAQQKQIQPNTAPGQTTQKDVDQLTQLEEATKRDAERAKWIQRAVRLGIPLGAAIAGSINGGILPEMAGLAQGSNQGFSQADEMDAKRKESEAAQQYSAEEMRIEKARLQMELDKAARQAEKDAWMQDFLNKQIGKGEFEISGYDSGGNPQITKAGPTLQEQKFQVQQEEKKKQQEVASQSIITSANDTLNTISEIEKNIDKFGLTGPIWAFGGTDKANWEANVNKLLSGKVIDLMKQMKDASKTGATGFGQLSEKELGILQGASTALNKKLKPQDAQRYLNQMKENLKKIASGQSQEQSQSDEYIKTPGGNEFKFK